MTNEQTIPQYILEELSSASQDLQTHTPSFSSNGASIPITYSQKGAKVPFKPPTQPKGVGVFSGDYWGTFSLEHFAAQSGLTYTHEDAWGWLSYLRQFQPENFRYLDENVRIWAYYDAYDNWQDTYGMDAVLAVYHSGHGGMLGDGRFVVPLGADWNNEGVNAYSDQMRLGNQQARYIFWSTCFSNRIFDGQSPIRTWNTANLGFRMLFGYETTSVDDPNYGSNFWAEYNRGKSLSTAFLDASWDISHAQVPVVVACGATQQEASDRVFNERYFSWDAVSKNWWWWRWYNVASSAAAIRPTNQTLPSDLLIAQLQPVSVNDRYVKQVLNRHDLSMRLPHEIEGAPNGIFHLQDGDLNAAFDRSGGYELRFAPANLDNRSALPVHQAISTAQDFIHQQRLEDVQLTFDRVMHAYAAGGSTLGSGQLEAPYITETTVQFTQVINGLPVIQPGKGRVAVTIDNDGTVTGVKNSTRSIAELTHTNRMTAAPPEAMPGSAARASRDPQLLLADAWQRQLASRVAVDRIPVSYRVVPGTYEVGYALNEDSATVVAREEIEVDCGNGYLKRYIVEVPIR